jgi:hypothetical protein
VHCVLQKAHHCAIVRRSRAESCRKVVRCVLTSQPGTDYTSTLPHLTSLDQSLNTPPLVLANGGKQSLQVVAVWHSEGCITNTIMLYKSLITNCTRKTFQHEVQAAMVNTSPDCIGSSDHSNGTRFSVEDTYFACMPSSFQCPAIQHAQHPNTTPPFDDFS